MKRITIALLVAALCATTFAANYGTLVGDTLFPAPYASCVGEEYWTNWIIKAEQPTNLPPYMVDMDYEVYTNRIYAETASLPESKANELGYKLVEDNRPVTDTNHYTVAKGWAQTNRIYRVYEILPVPPAPARRIYKYDLSAACVEYDRLDELISFISSDAKVKWFWDAAEILVEDDVFFISATNQVIQSGVIPESEVKSILDRAYELGQLSEVSK